MKVGIYGFPGAGKTTVYNVLAEQHAETGYGGRAEAHLAAIKVPDARVARLSEIFEPKKTTYAEIHFVDVPGKRGDGGKPGLDPDQLHHLRDADAFAIVLRDFESPYVDKAPDPLAEYLEIEAELILTDLLSVEKRLRRLRKEGKKTPELELMGRLSEQLGKEKPLREMGLDDKDLQSIRGFTFVSVKPQVVLISTTEDRIAESRPELEQELARRGIRHFALAAAVELEILDLDPEEREAFFEDLGLAGSSRSAFIREVYATLDLISFLTAGEDEVRAWTLEKGTTAVRAAGKIHSDIERGFIRAEVTPFEIYAGAGGDEAALRKAGKIRLEGKEYVVQDGEVVHFRFAV